MHIVLPQIERIVATANLGRPLPLEKFQLAHFKQTTVRVYGEGAVCSGITKCSCTLILVKKVATPTVSLAPDPKQ